LGIFGVVDCVYEGHIVNWLILLEGKGINPQELMLSEVLMADAALKHSWSEVKASCGFGRSLNIGRLSLPRRRGSSARIV
jgi:hypothetical protein